MSSNGRKPFHEKTRLHRARLPIIQIKASGLSGKPASQMPELTSPGRRTPLNSPSGKSSNPFYKPTPELMATLLKLAGIPSSVYQRQYPPVATVDTVCLGDDTTHEQTQKTVEDIIASYKLLEDRGFKKYLAAKRLREEMFDKNHFMWNRPASLLEIVVQYAFRYDPVLKNISFSGAHGYVLTYLDHEILTVHQPIRKEHIQESGKFKPIEVKYTCNGRPIIQQQATRGCSYAVAAMLIHQHHGTVSVSDLESTNLGGDKLIFQALSTAGLSPFKTRHANLEDLASAVNRDGSAIVTVSSLAGGMHDIIVDAVTDASVLIRDPYHGWEVEISRDAFKTSWDKDAIQVKQRIEN
ncbi:cysteine peptidase family C39 domain-containing protein [Endozoicomonas sp. GU-1]|uniref:cysteine peptidase family C39 domain-containing protein n=2 Tax=Endozoicomonas sp. GU-1 TaxID=3009078 RepID=UPI0022B428DB|nr:cysteine peptidase family C39 domain-containing protein [Endozoicomonas sp. GU-1]WBA80772.1 cysteine peptidase family C39 domain-containing protein [Endozoicomonas sp. GU-1]